MDYRTALDCANEILGALAPYCIRIGIAGSIRRKKAEGIKDVELVAIPRPANARELHEIVNSRWGRPSAGAFPSRYTKIRSARSIDLFWTDAERWGLIYFIRTGPADFSHGALAHWKRITNGGYSEEGILHRASGEVVATLEEADVFRVMNVPFIPPEKRFKFPR